MVKVFEMIQNYTSLFLRRDPVCAQEKLLELIILNCKIKNIVYEHYHWVIYKMLFREELNLNSNSNSIGVYNTFIYVHHRHFKQWKMKLRTKHCGLFFVIA